MFDPSPSGVAGLSVLMTDLTSGAVCSAETSCLSVLKLLYNMNICSHSLKLDCSLTFWDVCRDSFFICLYKDSLYYFLIGQIKLLFISEEVNYTKSTRIVFDVKVAV